MDNITERQKLSTASYHARQKAVILINWSLVNLAMCQRLGHSVTNNLCCHHRWAPLHCKVLSLISEKRKETQVGQLQHTGKDTQKKYACQLIHRYPSISRGLTCAIFFEFWPKHILPLLSLEDLLLVD